MSTATPPEWKIDYQAAAGHCHDADYAAHARRLIECLSDENSWVYYENISFPASVKAVVTGKAVFLFDKEAVHAPPELIETRTYLLKESRVIGAIGISVPAIPRGRLSEPRPEKAGDAGWVAEADLDVIQGAEAGGGIDGRSFVEEAANAVEWRQARFFSKIMEVVQDCAIEEAGFGFGSFVSGWCNFL